MEETRPLVARKRDVTHAPTTVSGQEQSSKLARAHMRQRYGEPFDILAPQRDRVGRPDQPTVRELGATPRCPGCNDQGCRRLTYRARPIRNVNAIVTCLALEGSGVRAICRISREPLMQATVGPRLRASTSRVAPSTTQRPAVSSDLAGRFYVLAHHSGSTAGLLLLCAQA